MHNTDGNGNGKQISAVKRIYCFLLQSCHCPQVAGISSDCPQEGDTGFSQCCVYFYIVQTVYCLVENLSNAATHYNAETTLF